MQNVTVYRFKIVSFRRYCYHVVVLLVLSLLLMACNRDDNPEPTATPAIELPPTATVAPTATAYSTQSDDTSGQATEGNGGTGSTNTESTEGADNTNSGVGTDSSEGETAEQAAETVVCDIQSDMDLDGYAELLNLDDVVESMGCPRGDALTEPIALNEFGPGPDFDRFMLWFSHEQQIYVLFPDGTWQTFEDTWTEEQPTFLCNPLDGEATSPPLPRRGFGKVWCMEEEVQAQLGTIEKEERLCQYSILQEFELGRLLACFEDATIRYFRILDDGSWDLADTISN